MFAIAANTLYALTVFAMVYATITHDNDRGAP